MQVSHRKMREIIYKSFLASYSDVNFRLLQFADMDINSSKCKALYWQMRFEILIHLVRCILGILVNATFVMN